MLNNIGLPGLLLIAVVVLVLFGRGKVSSLMGEVGKGINAFKKGVKESDDEIRDAATDPAPDALEDRRQAEALRDSRLRDVTPAERAVPPATGAAPADRDRI